MSLIGQSTYILGQIFVVQPTVEQRTALGTNPRQRVEVFSRLYKDGTVYHSSSYNKAITNKRYLFFSFV